MSKATILAGGLAFTAALVAGLTAALPSGAEPLRYWGRHPGASTGWLEVEPDVLREIAPGSAIGAWGRVREIRDDRLVLERELTEREKEDLRDRGAIAYDVLEIHVIREDLRQPPSRARPDPLRPP